MSRVLKDYAAFRVTGWVIPTNVTPKKIITMPTHRVKLIGSLNSRRTRSGTTTKLAAEVGITKL